MSTRVALCDIRGPLNDLLQKLSGDDGARWLRALKQTLRKENAWEWEGRAKKLFVWKTLTLGVYKNPSAYSAALKKAKCEILTSAHDLLLQVDVSKEKIILDLVVLSPADIGFTTRHISYSEVNERAIDCGLLLCPPEVGPALRLAYTDQPKGYDAYLNIGMEGLKSGDTTTIFALSTDSSGTLQLGSAFAAYGSSAKHDDRFVFVRPSQ